jgi:hypothetical protein
LRDGHLKQKVAIVEEEIVEGSSDGLLLLEGVKELYLLLNFGPFISYVLLCSEPGTNTRGFALNSFSTPLVDREYFLANYLTSLSSLLSFNLLPLDHH